ncbi:aminopeptidase P family N-terminal domain-containing protein, partial [Gordonibacter pamelaeae]|nr:aminopeptidase P family N-terminal domain-containing protein [Gordonibacter pamelaeae]
GYTGDDSYLLLTQEKNYFITDSRYTEQASYECPEYEILNWREAGTTVAGTIAKVVEEKGLKAVGFEADEVLFSSYRRMEEVIKAELV